MALVNQIEKKVRLSQWEIIKYQILTHCYLNNIQVSNADLECLTYLSTVGEQELTQFCNEVSKKNIFQSCQTVRNALTKAETKNLIIKQGKTKKRIFINPSLNIQVQGNILINYKFVAVAS